MKRQLSPGASSCGSPLLGPRNALGLRVPVGNPPVVFCTPGNRDLCDRVVRHLSWTDGKARFRKFANGEISVKLEQSVANCDVFVVCSRDDLEGEINFTLMQLLLMLDALKSEAPHRITVILPCLEYARQDRKFEAGEAVAPKLFLHLMVTAGANRFVTIDLHNQAESGFSPAHTCLDELSADMYLAHFIQLTVPDFDSACTVVCATDAGGAKRTRRMADELGVGFMMADKFRPKPGESQSAYKIIADASSAPQNVIIVDDMFDTCGSLVKVVEAVHAFAPDARIFAVGTHGYFSGDAQVKIQRMASVGLQWIAVTNTVAARMPQQKFKRAGIANLLKVIDISRLVAGAIIRIHLGASVNLAKFRRLGPTDADPLLAEAACVPTTQFTLDS